MKAVEGIRGVAAAAVAISAIMVAAACHERFIVIQVKKPPDIDPSVYKRVGVLPFEGEEDEGLLAAKRVREEVAAEELFLVEPAETVEAALDRVDFFDPSSRDQALALGTDLGVDAVLIGEVEFIQRTYSPEGDVRNELYTADRQGIAPFELGSSYATRYMDVNLRYTLRMTVKALDVRTGRLMRRREFEATTMQTYSQSEVTDASFKEKDIFDQLLGEAVDDFVYTLQPHDVAQTREVARF
ncbi:MAG TPA: hypothetical protein VMX79_09895 [bacterium]|nr:hypothetical protein [bacterium]